MDNICHLMTHTALTEEFTVNNGFTYLGRAVRDGDLGKVKELLQKQPDLDAVDFYNKTALQHAAERGWDEIASFLIQSGSSVNWTDSYGTTAMHIAACNGRTAVCNVLVTAGCDVDLQTTDGLTALHCACGNGHRDIVTRLLSAGANVNLVGLAGRTALCIAAECGYTDIVKQILCVPKAKINKENDYGMTPLCDAVIQNKTEAALALIDFGARVNKCDNKRFLPLHYAVRNRNVELVQALLEAGSKRNKLNRHAETPSHIAARMAHVDILKMLVQYGSDVNACEDNIDVTPLHLAVNHDVHTFREIFYILLDAKCDINCQTYATLETPLYIAIDLNKTSIAEILIKHGADPYRESFSATTLRLAYNFRENMRVVKLLLVSGMNLWNEEWLFGHRDKVMDAKMCTHQTRISQNGVYGSTPELIKEKKALLTERLFSVRSLQDMCRVVIRTQLGEHLMSKVDTLQYPKRLKSFLMMDNV